MYEEENDADEGGYVSNIEENTNFETEGDSDIKKLMMADKNGFGFKRTWRDTEKYREMRELYKIINDELYTGICDEDFFESEQ